MWSRSYSSCRSFVRKPASIFSTNVVYFGFNLAMRGIMTSYSMYFNKKYGLSGVLFESRYKASRISSDEYLMHISRYIHLNPKDWMAYPYSSIHSYYLSTPEWLHPEPVVELFGSLPKYADLLNDYVDYKKSLEQIKEELANTII